MKVFATWFTLAAALAAPVVQDLPSQASGAPSAASAPDAAQDPATLAPGAVGDESQPAAAQPIAEAVAEPVAEPVAAPVAALDELTQLLERNEAQRAAELASALAMQLGGNDGDAAVLASRAAWSSEQRAHLAYCGGLAKARCAAAALALEAPDEQALLALEDAANTWFARAASAAGPGELRDNALAAPGVVLAWRGEREVRAAQSQAMLQRSPVPFGKDTPEREALLAARTTLVAARAALVVRLEHDWRDVDNRANLEWVARRLFEIDRIIERADEQDEQQEQQEQQQNEQQDGEQDEPSEEGGEPEDGEPGEGDEDGEQGEDGEPREDGGESENGSPNDQEGENAQPQDSSTEERGTEAPTGDGSQAADSAAPPMPATLGDVEVQRLLNRLADIEKDAEQLRRRLRATERRRVEKDW